MTNKPDRNAPSSRSSVKACSSSAPAKAAKEAVSGVAGASTSRGVGVVNRAAAVRRGGHRRLRSVPRIRTSINPRTTSRSKCERRPISRRFRFPPRGSALFRQAHLEDRRRLAFLSTWAGGQTQGLIRTFERRRVVSELREDDQQTLFNPALGQPGFHRMELRFPRKRPFDGFKQSHFH